jgi:hypothetical protein
MDAAIIFPQRNSFCGTTFFNTVPNLMESLAAEWMGSSTAAEEQMYI